MVSAHSLMVQRQTGEYNAMEAALHSPVFFCYEMLFMFPILLKLLDW